MKLLQGPHPLPGRPGPPGKKNRLDVINETWCLIFLHPRGRGLGKPTPVLRPFSTHPEGPAPSSRLRLGNCGHSHPTGSHMLARLARPGWNISRLLLPASPLDAVLPVSQGTGSLCCCRPFLQAPLVAFAHAEHLYQPHLVSPALLLAAPSPRATPHSWQLTPGSQTLLRFISPLKDPYSLGLSSSSSSSPI